MRFLQAKYVFTGLRLMEDAVLVLNDDDRIDSVVYPEEVGNANIEFFEGILCPGFINVHCHLELSHMRAKVERGKGLPKFIYNVIRNRHADMRHIAEQAEAADKEMWKNGIVAVGDISNTLDSFVAKSKSKMRYYTFIEVFGLYPEDAAKQFNDGLSLLDELSKNKNNTSGSITPHAPYSVSPKLFEKIYGLCYSKETAMSMHNQETPSENEMFLSGSGALYDALSSAKALPEGWKAPGFRSLEYTIVQLPRCNNILLVHNTYSDAYDMDKADKYTNRLYWATCPKANLFIENRLPNYDLWREKKLKICVGTDSLASNDKLCILDELKAIQEHYPHIPTPELLQWATRNGADYFEYADLGSFKPGSKPGINHITGFESTSLKLTQSSRVQKLM